VAEGIDIKIWFNLIIFLVNNILSTPYKLVSKYVLLMHVQCTTFFHVDGIFNYKAIYTKKQLFKKKYLGKIII
tara:strand:+ start:625 stop:843 length:219 start_codon:yes stop_codon:yes gene_type:complete